MYYMDKLFLIHCLNPAMVHVAPGIFCVHTVEKQHMEVNIQVGGTAQALNQSHRVGLGRDFTVTDLLMRCVENVRESISSTLSISSG